MPPCGKMLRLCLNLALIDFYAVVSILLRMTLYRRAISGEVTTGGSVYLIGAENGPVSSPTDGKKVLLAAADPVGTDLALSALLLGWTTPLGGDPLLLLLLRSRVSTGETGNDCAIGI